MGIVIGGAPRSGTTLLLSVLSGHPDVFAIPHETYALVAEEPAIPNRLRTLLGPRWAGEWVEKTPLNVRNIGAILETVPDVRFIHIVRDGRDVVTSRFPGHQHYEVFPGGWAKDVTMGLEYQDHPQVYTVRYESFVLDFGAELALLCDFLGLPLTEEIRSYPEHATVQLSQAWPHAAISIHANAIGRWRQPEHAERVDQFYADPFAVETLARIDKEVR